MTVRGAAATSRLVVLGTTDLHGHVLNWDYFTGREYDDPAHDDVGLAKISTLVAALRAQYPHALLLDAGDTIQGNPLAYHAARVDPIGNEHLHPMAAAMNHIGFDAAALGNHEFNYGIELLHTFAEQLDFPLLGANVLDAVSGEPAFPPYVVRDVALDDGNTVRVGVLGLVTPGVAIWDRTHVEGRLRFDGIVETAARWVPVLQAGGAEVVLVCCHSGAHTSSSYGGALPFPENASSLLAEQVPGIDAILVGHAHREIAELKVRNRSSGRDVLLSEPLKFGMRLTVMEFSLARSDGRWSVASSSARVLHTNRMAEDAAVVSLVRADHDAVRAYLDSPIGTCTDELTTADACWRDVPAVDFINHVQGSLVSAGVAGTSWASLPVLSIASPFSRSASIPSGVVSVRDVAGLYAYDNTLLAVRLTGAQVRAHLEFSARYFRRQRSAGPVAARDVTNAVAPTAPHGTPDYNYDIVAGYAAPLTYQLDLSAPAGTGRVRELAYDDRPVEDDESFVVAVNNYRQSGGGGYPDVATAPVVFDPQTEIRQAILDWVADHAVIDPAQFASVDWRLTYGDEPLLVRP